MPYSIRDLKERPPMSRAEGLRRWLRERAGTLYTFEELPVELREYADNVRGDWLVRREVYGKRLWGDPDTVRAAMEVHHASVDPRPETKRTRPRRRAKAAGK